MGTRAPSPAQRAQHAQFLASCLPSRQPFSRFALNGGEGARAPSKNSSPQRESQLTHHHNLPAVVLSILSNRPARPPIDRPPGFESPRGDRAVRSARWSPQRHREDFADQDKSSIPRD